MMVVYYLFFNRYEVIEEWQDGIFITKLTNGVQMIEFKKHRVANGLIFLIMLHCVFKCKPSLKSKYFIIKTKQFDLIHTLQKKISSIIQY